MNAANEEQKLWDEIVLEKIKQGSLASVATEEADRVIEHRRKNKYKKEGIKVFKD